MLKLLIGKLSGTNIFGMILVGILAAANTSSVYSLKLVARAPQKLESSVAQDGIRMYTDKQGNVILFSRHKNQHATVHSTSLSLVENSLTYRVYSNNKNKWLKTLAVPITRDGQSDFEVKDFSYFPNYSKNSNILFYRVNSMPKNTNSSSNKKIDLELWSMTQQGMLGVWDKPKRLFSIKSSEVDNLSIRKTCSSQSCIVAWRSVQAGQSKGKTTGRPVVMIRSLRLNRSQEQSWGPVLRIMFPVNHKVLQYDISLLGSENIVLVWLAALPSSSSKTIQLALFAQRRISGKWQDREKVVELGGEGGASSVGEFYVSTNKSGHILIVWSEQGVTSQLSSRFYNGKWTPVSNVYRDNPDTRHLNVRMSNKGDPKLVWQQKYGKYSHVFGSQFDRKLNKWSVPTKLDQSSQRTSLKSVSHNSKNEMAVLWIKEQQKLQFILIDEQNKVIVRHSILPTVGEVRTPVLALSRNKFVIVAWLKSTSSGFELWSSRVSIKSGQK